MKRSQCKVEKYRNSMLKFGACDDDINRVTGYLYEKNNELAELLQDIDLLDEKLEKLKKLDAEQKLLLFRELNSIPDECNEKENTSAECDIEVALKSKPVAGSCNSSQLNRRRYSLLVSQLKNSLRMVETAEFTKIPPKTRGRIGRLELNELLKKVNEIFSEKYVCKKRPPLALMHSKKQECEKLRGRWYITLNELLIRFTSKEKISWKFGLLCLIHLKRLEEIRVNYDVFIAAVLS